jgi:hypothetical protein
MKENINVAGVNVSVQAAIVVFWGTILFVTLLVLSPYLGVAGLFLVLPMLLTAYNINCTVNGKCKTWAWVLSIVYSAYVIMVVVGLIFLHRDNKLDVFKQYMDGSIKLKDLKKYIEKN